MTYSKLGSDGTLSEQSDPRTGKALPVFLPTLDPSGKERPVYLYKSSRSQGVYIVGATGAGKSGLIENLCYEDGNQGIGFCVIDPHGQLVDHVLARLPDKREKDVILLDIENEDYPFGLNLFTCRNPKSVVAVQEVVDRVYHIFEKLLGVSEETQLILEYLLNCTYTLVANPGYTMADMPLLLTDQNCRNKLVANVTESEVLGFWRRYEQMQQGKQSEEIASTIRRVRRLLQPVIRPIVGQSVSTIHLPTIMDTGKILLVKLNVMRLEQASHLIGSLLIALFLNATDARTTRNLFNIYVDEFQRFATEDFATLLTEARKYGIGTTIAHQARYQPGMTEGIRATTLQAANLIVFRVPTDAEELAKQFKATPKPPDIIEEPIRVRATDGVYDRLLNGHPNETVRRFMKTYGGSWRHYLGPVQEAENVISYLKSDKVFEQVNAGADPEQVLKRYYHHLVEQAIWTGPQQQREKYYRKLEPSLRAALQALAQEPVMVDTGRFNQKPGPEETIANAQARGAEELVHLPDHIARVKMRMEETVEGVKRSRIVEHTIQTSAPGKGVYGTALQERVERIHQQNRIPDVSGQVYCRAKDSVEAEITERQTQFDQPGFSPPQAPPAARKALPCASCGFSNPIGSKFCNQCGAKL